MRFTPCLHDPASSPRRLSHRFVILLLLAASLGVYAAPPNVVMIISDDQHWGDYGFMGHPQIQTPHLDRLARESLTCRHGYVPSSLCCPSLASIITGRYPHEHRITSNDPTKPDRIPLNEFVKTPAFQTGRARMVRDLAAWPTLPGILGQAGYVSLQTGKWWLGDYTHGGFTAGMTQGGRHGDEGLTIGRKTLQPITAFITAAQQQQKPFFIWYAPLMPHDPHTPPERLLAKYRAQAPSERIAKYWAMVEWFDETCGELLAHLDRAGLTKNTLVVYVADNGWITQPQAAGYAPKSKQSPYDGGLRTPLMLRWPGTLAPRTSDTPVSSLDLFPTILQACGVPAPRGLPGINLADPRAIAARPAIIGECFTHNFVDQNDPATSLRWRWILADGWKLIVPAPQNEAGQPELYHLSADPHEAHNLAAQESSRVKALHAQLDAQWPGTVR